MYIWVHMNATQRKFCGWEMKNIFKKMLGKKTHEMKFAKKFDIFIFSYFFHVLLLNTQMYYESWSFPWIWMDTQNFIPNQEHSFKNFIMFIRSRIFQVKWLSKNLCSNVSAWVQFDLIILLKRRFYLRKFVSNINFFAFFSRIDIFFRNCLQIFDIPFTD